MTAKNHSPARPRRSREGAREPAIRSGTPRRAELEAECRRVADLFLTLGWGSAHSQVSAVIETMVKEAKLRRESIAWLLEQAADHPMRFEPVRRLNELAALINELRLEKGSRRSLY